MTIRQLIDKYSAQRKYYLTEGYNETLLRSDFLDPFFELLGWDIKNHAGSATNEREVVLEEALRERAREHARKPDYTFRLFAERKFFVEAKKPFVSVESDHGAAKQVRRYGFTAKLKISVLSNFEYLLIYDTSVRVEEGDSYTRALVKKYHYTEYEEKFGEILDLLGREAVYTGAFDATWMTIGDKLDRYSVDTLFLEQFNQWRTLLGSEIYRLDPGLGEQRLNDVVQSYLNRILFLRVCEDRNLEDYQALLVLADAGDFRALVEKFRLADRRYNSGLFDQLLGEEIIEDISSAFWTIIWQLYYPESPYSFSVFSSDILGRIYEIFLSEKLVVVGTGLALVKKPENVDRDIVTTPTFIIHDILRHTVNAKCSGRSDVEILGMKFADIACGSGAFLSELFQLLNDTIIDFYLGEDRSKLVQTNIDTYKLPFEMKRRLLLNCVYGVDKDYNAVEAAKFGLLLKLLEDEDMSSTSASRPVLPDLSGNIFFGNSLLEPSQVKRADQGLVNPFDFGGLRFDAIVGNPPYMKSEDMKNITPLELPLYKVYYKDVAHKQFDKYFLFLSRGMGLLKEEGLLGYIVPSKFAKVGAGAKLRQLLVTKGYVQSIISFGANQVFSDKTTYTSILVLGKRARKDFLYTEVKNLEEWKIRDFHRISFERMALDSLSGELWFLVPPYLKKAYDAILGQSVPLEKVVGGKNINNGIQTSANSVLVFKAEREDADYYYFTKMGREHQVEKTIVKPYYETNRKKGELKLYTYRTFMPNAQVIYPYKKVGDRIEFIELDELRSVYPETYRYLHTPAIKERLFINDNGRKRSITPKPRTENEWYRYGRSQYLDLGMIAEKIIVGVMSSGEKYAIDSRQTLYTAGGTAGYCSIYLPEGSPYSIYYVQAILSSRYVEWIAQLRGEVFRGGYIARGTKLLKNLPIRTIDFTDGNDRVLHDEIVLAQRELIRLQDEMDRNAGDRRLLTPLQGQFARGKAGLERLLAQLYGLGDDDLLIPTIRELYETN